MIGRRGRRRGGTRVAATPKLRITSMMDILTVLLLFLLKSFVVDGEVATPPAGVELPGSTAEEVPEASLVIAISEEAILVGNEPVTTVAEALAGLGPGIPALDARLAEARAQMDELARLKGTEVADGQITIQGDRDLEFRLLQRVMATCSERGFERLALAVVRES